ncbi:hypothetical protein R3W88_002801 [Solanum pinnatisectum]|uniref:Uncharacterized protein n=1 Tax=Solanum pinnatisectum TaxID=50273 RepID=A0AAV9MM62_9SOLN|nr:hypothetical protein R3W88_002801 [Solanum pinnatisectum]
MKAHAIHELIVCRSVAAVLLLILCCFYIIDRKKKSPPLTRNVTGSSPAIPPRPKPLLANRHVEMREIKPKVNTTMRDGGMVNLDVDTATVVMGAVLINSADRGGGGGGDGGTTSSAYGGGGGCGGGGCGCCGSRIYRE